jgi:hypothetical protein
VTEKPFVASGGKACCLFPWHFGFKKYVAGHGMEFYWKDNKDQVLRCFDRSDLVPHLYRQLYVRRGDLPSKGTSDPWTRFEMTLREAGSIPPAFDFMRFLASSITFMVHLNEVGVFFDEHRIGHIKKSPGLPKALDLPRGLRRSSDQNVMNVKAIQFCRAFCLCLSDCAHVDRDGLSSHQS